MTRRLAPYFALALLLSWAIWFPLLAEHDQWIDSASPYLHLIGSLGPAVAAFSVAMFLGRDEVKILLRGMTCWRVNWKAWAFAVGGPLCLLAVGLGLSRVIEGTWPTWTQLSRVAEFPQLVFLARLIAEIVFYGFGEEIGWRGFALPRLRAKWGWLWGAILLSLPWALWHFPLLIRNETYSSMNPGLLAGWFFSLLTGSVLMAWLSHLSGGSLPVLAVFHGLLDVVMVNDGVSQLALTGMGAVVTLWGLAAAWKLWQLDQSVNLSR